MELRALQYFVTVAEELHFGRAAQRLNIVQPAVSQQIVRLERELGVRLLDRTSRRVRLTPAGARVLAAARETLAAAARVRVVAGEPAAALRIGVASCVTGRLDRALARLHEAERPAEPELVDLPVAARLDAVRGGDLDLALVRGTLSAPSLTVVRAWSEPLHVVMGRTHPAAGRDAVPSPISPLRDCGCPPATASRPCTTPSSPRCPSPPYDRPPGTCCTCCSRWAASPGRGR